MFGTVFQTDQKTTKQHKQLNNKTTKQPNNDSLMIDNNQKATIKFLIVNIF